MIKRLTKLDALRGFAAIYVMFYHLAGKKLQSFGYWAAPARMGPEAVMLFFLISGFAIFLSTAKMQPTVGTYFIHRARRILPIYFLGLVVGFINISVTQSGPFPWGTLVANLAMLQDVSMKPGTWFPVFAGIDPFWSLSYEWWFYWIFFLIWKLVPVTHWSMTALGLSSFGLFSYVLYPNQISLFLIYFIIWWTGAELAREYLVRRKITKAGQIPTLTRLAIFSGVSSCFFLLWHRNGFNGVGEYPFLLIRHFWAAVLFVCGGLLWQRLGWIGFDATFGKCILVAPISYGIYVFHYPICLGGHFFDIFSNLWVREMLMIVGTLSVAWCAETRLQPIINKFCSMRRL
jgi:peptidoglycan/LPS O-acetylase OafA/YrhL